MQINAGSIIQRRLTDSLGHVYQHIGIFVSEDEVIHFNGTQKGDPDAVVKSESLDDFAAGCDVTIKDCPCDAEHASAVVKEARQQITKENDFDRKYNLFRNNCEDFALHCFQIKFTSVSDPGRTRQVLAPMSQRKKTIWNMVVTAAVTVVPAILIIGRSFFLRDKRS